MKFWRYYKRIQGFTLVEILVVLGLFSSISAISLGALFNAQAINGHLQEVQAILDNVNLSAQTLTRNIRYGSNFHCNTTLPGTTDDIVSARLRKSCTYSDGGGSVLIFRPADSSSSNDRVAYYIRNGTLFMENYPASGASSTLQMTANDVMVQSVTFYVDGAESLSSEKNVSGVAAENYKQPIITMLISGYAKHVKSSGSLVTFNLQTTISPRELK